MNLEKTNWDHLRILKVVAEAGSISAAARGLGESAPTISRRVDSLEKSLNAVLFARSTKGLILTEAGTRALAHVEAMAEAAEALNNEVSDFDSPAEGPITLVTGDGLGPHWIGPHLPGFHLGNPKIQLQLKVSDQPHDLLGGEADIAVQFTEPKHQDIVFKKLGTAHYMCFASQAYLDTYGEPQSIFDFANHRCIFHSGYLNQMASWPNKTREMQKILDFALVTNSGSVMLAVCASGGGIAIMPSYVASMDKRLVPLSIPEIVTAKFWITYTERVRRLPRGQIVIDWIKSLFDPRKHVWFRPTFHHPLNVDEVDRTAPPKCIISENAAIAE